MYKPIVNEQELTILIDQWNDLTNTALGQAPIKGEYFSRIAKNTFRMLTTFDNTDYVPKSIVSLLTNMAEFAAYEMLSSAKQEIEPVVCHVIAIRLIWQFEKGYKKCGSVYPVLSLPKDLNRDRIDLEKEDISELRLDAKLPF